MDIQKRDVSVNISYYTDCGGRKYNEDHIKLVKHGGTLCAVLADGLGGHGGGDVASRTASSVICDLFAAEGDISQEKIKDYYTAANYAVLKAATPNCQMKSTMVSLFLAGNTVSWAHVGDSRLYHFYGGKLVFQTKDHSVSQMAVMMGEITPHQIRHHEDRSRLVFALGNDEIVKPDIVAQKKLDRGFHAFLLCSDGFWEYVTEEEMEADIAKSATAELWLKHLRERLYARIPRDNDNNSAIAIFCEV